MTHYLFFIILTWTGHYTAVNDNSPYNPPPFMFAVPGGFQPGWGERGGFGEGIQKKG